MLVVYVFGAPALAFVVLFKNRKKLNNPEVVRYIIILYQGLKHEVYFWEIVNTLRKILLLSYHVFIPDSLKIMKALFGVVTIFLISMLQARIKPFKIGVLTTLGNSNV